MRRLLLTSCAVLFLLVITAWVRSVATLYTNSTGARTAQPLPEAAIPLPPQGASLHDVVVLDLAIRDSGIQQRRGVLLVRRERLPQLTFPISVLADGHTHRSIIPVGMHPNWTGTPQDIRLVFPQHPPLSITVSTLQIQQRPWWAIDMLIGRLLATSLPVFPPWPGVLILTATLLTAGIAGTWPIDMRRQRATTVGVVLAASCTVVVLTLHASHLAAIIQAYAPLDDRAAAYAVPTYTASAQINQALVATPDGEQPIRTRRGGPAPRIRLPR